MNSEMTVPVPAQVKKANRDGPSNAECAI